MIGLVSITDGAAGIAAYTVGERLSTLAIVPARGLQQAAQSMIAQNLGGRNPRRARRTTLIGVGIATSTLAVLGGI